MNVCAVCLASIYKTQKIQFFRTLHYAQLCMYPVQLLNRHLTWTYWYCSSFTHSLCLSKVTTACNYFLLILYFSGTLTIVVVLMGVWLVLDSPMLPQSHVHSVLCSLSPMFPQSYVPSVLCSLTPMFPQSYVPSVLCSLSPMLPQSYVPLVLCSLSPMFPQLYVASVMCDVFVIHHLSSWILNAAPLSSGLPSQISPVNQTLQVVQ